MSRLNRNMRGPQKGKLRLKKMSTLKSSKKDDKVSKKEAIPSQTDQTGQRDATNNEE